jgi:hypothetical protein
MSGFPNAGAAPGGLTAASMIEIMDQSLAMCPFRADTSQ